MKSPITYLRYIGYSIILYTVLKFYLNMASNPATREYTEEHDAAFGESNKHYSAYANSSRRRVQGGLLNVTLVRSPDSMTTQKALLSCGS